MDVYSCISVCVCVCVHCCLHPTRQGQGGTPVSPQVLPREQRHSYLERKWKRIDAEEKKDNSSISMGAQQQLYMFIIDSCVYVCLATFSLTPSCYLQRTACTDTQTYLDSNNLVLGLHHFDKGEEKLPDARVADEGDSLGGKASFGFTAQQRREGVVEVAL